MADNFMFQTKHRLTDIKALGLNGLAKLKGFIVSAGSGEEIGLRI